MCPTWPKTLWSGSWWWTPASGWQRARPSSTPGWSAWPPPPPTRTSSAPYLRTSWSGRRRAATAPSRRSPPAPAAPPNPTRPGGWERKSCGSWTVAISSSTMAETGTTTLYFKGKQHYNDWHFQNDQHRSKLPPVFEAKMANYTFKKRQKWMKSSCCHLRIPLAASLRMTEKDKPQKSWTPRVTSSLHPFLHFFLRKDGAFHSFFAFLRIPVSLHIYLLLLTWLLVSIQTVTG